MNDVDLRVSILEIFAEAQTLGRERPERVVGRPHRPRLSPDPVLTVFSALPRWWKTKVLGDAPLTVVPCKLEIVRREPGYRWELREGCARPTRVRDDDVIDEAAE